MLYIECVGEVLIFCYFAVIPCYFAVIPSIVLLIYGHVDPVADPDQAFAEAVK